MVGTVKKSIAAIWPTWFFRKMRQFCEGGLGWRIMYLATVDSATAWPSRSNSDRILGAPQVAFSRHMRRSKSRIARSALGRPGFLRDFHHQ